MSYIGIFIKKQIRKYGVDVPRKAYTETDIGNGEVEVSYTDQEPVRGHFLQITPLDEVLEFWGRRIEADCIGTFLPDTILYEKDLLFVNDDWYEIMSIFDRRTSTVIDYREVHLRRRQ